jgi:hypothetical protein
MKVEILAIGGTECMDHRWRGSKSKFHAGTATTWWLLLLWNPPGQRTNLGKQSSLSPIQLKGQYFDSEGGSQWFA